MPDRRAEYVERWLNRARNERDVFDQFISAWIALTIAVKRHCTESGSSCDKKDSELVFKYLEDHPSEVKAAFESHGHEMQDLAGRRGTGGCIVLDGGNELQRHCKLFAKGILGRATCTDEEMNKATAAILVRIRNNVFHGNKVYDDASDRELLTLVTPLLLTIVGTCEGIPKT